MYKSKPSSKDTEQKASFVSSLPRHLQLQIFNKMTGTSSVASQKRLTGKVSIITGGASGIGACAVQLFHDNGAKVVIADIQDNQGQALAQKFGEVVCYIHCDVSNEDEVSNLVDATVKKYGKLDIMYNNAGILDRCLGSILDTPKSDLERLIGVNLVGCFLGAKHAARVMVTQGQGCILFTASACTAIGGLATPAYGVTKHGIVGLAKNLAAELGQYGIRVNCVSPFGVATPMSGGFSAGTAAMIEESLEQMGNLKGKIPKVEDVARAALYLASDEANYVSGLNLVVDGGFSVVNPTVMKALYSAKL
ncbi:PREDICTED: tropinone reductase-like 1 [Populus euphratica]|uniref:Tropinone reductase-like 1 n=1 Tax=Populus euphratica TaxID=75702 RepID=A0AAJ6VEG4_POPEU|nr:PREDICTED: tropinone reductase-like 1 [Populus euphratica]